VHTAFGGGFRRKQIGATANSVGPATKRFATNSKTVCTENLIYSMMSAMDVRMGSPPRQPFVTSFGQKRARSPSVPQRNSVGDLAVFRYRYSF